ncbi:hypothetical protein L227DRAFT_387940 [Lentinus tigrinus ALCF2SS1-6]|uniref:Uncharacterized protein n=1 Tax=Lentinus tigrinus ALCF2SS1-6 TaxID=1328759 RepID=A0A5C2SPJ8_9APHY|nr:hypothetical protein L227DRAFT_387940 [Lentinus tigrinus ALCF2SS1-6]
MPMQMQISVGRASASAPRRASRRCRLRSERVLLSRCNCELCQAQSSLRTHHAGTVALQLPFPSSALCDSDGFPRARGPCTVFSSSLSGLAGIVGLAPRRRPDKAHATPFGRQLATYTQFGRGSRRELHDRASGWCTALCGNWQRASADATLLLHPPFGPYVDSSRGAETLCRPAGAARSCRPPGRVGGMMHVRSSAAPSNSDASWPPRTVMRIAGGYGYESVLTACVTEMPLEPAPVSVRRQRREITYTQRPSMGRIAQSIWGADSVLILDPRPPIGHRISARRASCFVLRCHKEALRMHSRLRG